MAKSVNKVILLGNLGKDPEVKYTPQGTAVAKITLATNERFKDKTSGEWKERTEWHNVVLWERLAEIAGEYLKKGSKVYLEGQIPAGEEAAFNAWLQSDPEHLELLAQQLPATPGPVPPLPAICTRRYSARGFCRLT